MKTKFITLSVIVLVAFNSLYAMDIANTIIPTKHNKTLSLSDMAEIQPGLGTIMMEFGHRFYITYYAAKASNWELAKYEIDELIEAQEVAETTRPKYTTQLKEFESAFISKLQNSIEKKDWELFKKNYEQTTNACNRCHKENEHPYIQYRLPKEAPKYLKMAL